MMEALSRVQRHASVFSFTTPGAKEPQGQHRMEIKTRFGCVKILRVQRSTELAAWLRLVDAVDEVMEDGCKYVVLDMRRVDDVSTGGMIVLQTIVARAASRGGKAVLCRVTNAVARILEVMQVGEDEIFPDLFTAIGALSNLASNRQ